MKITASIFAASALFLATASASFAIDPAELTIEISGFDTHEGAVMLGVYNSEDGWNSNDAINGARVEINGDIATVTLEGLAPGEYAVKMFHDINGDGEMSVNGFGMPTEPFGFSNNAMGQFGPASWADAHFTVTDGSNSHAMMFE